MMNNTQLYGDIHTTPCYTCYLCHVEGAVLYANLQDRIFGVPGEWNLRKCSNLSCGLIWLDPKPINEDISKLYISYYTHAEAKTRHIRPTRLTLWRRSLEENVMLRTLGYGSQKEEGKYLLLVRLLSHLGIVRDYAGAEINWLKASWCGRLLDNGCGSGEILAKLRALGWDTVGIDPDPKAVEVARTTFGLNVYQGTLENTPLSEPDFDVIMMRHVVEHLPDPRETFKTCRQLLKPGGRLVVVTPNVESLTHRWLGKNWRGLESPRHLHLFSTKTLSDCATSAGFVVEEVRSSAKAAAYIWRCSNHLRKYGELPHGLPARPGLLWRVLENLFWIWEHILMRIVPCGEELLLVAQIREQNYSETD
jgi:2-polyprenyl-3-methyl-5-hydroxy-6-metoxy-1,4-benzoquinol methylase